jgi:hypothetical protein
VTGKMTFPAEHSAVLAFYVGGGGGGRRGGLNLPGLEIDELAIYDLALPVLEATAGNRLSGNDHALLVKAEQGARKCLDRIVGLQRWGGWQTLYT